VWVWVWVCGLCESRAVLTPRLEAFLSQLHTMYAQVDKVVLPTRQDFGDDWRLVRASLMFFPPPPSSSRDCGGGAGGCMACDAWHVMPSVVPCVCACGRVPPCGTRQRLLHVPTVVPSGAEWGRVVQCVAV